MDLCAERVAALNMYLQSGRRWSGASLPSATDRPMAAAAACPAVRAGNSFLQLSEKNRNMEILVDFETRETVRLESLVPNWWGWSATSGKESIAWYADGGRALEAGFDRRFSA